MHVTLACDASSPYPEELPRAQTASSMSALNSPSSFLSSGQPAALPCLSRWSVTAPYQPFGWLSTPKLCVRSRRCLHGRCFPLPSTRTRQVLVTLKSSKRLSRLFHVLNTRGQ
eukprot:2518974-Rhodomonas_salina.2